MKYLLIALAVLFFVASVFELAYLNKSYPKIHVLEMDLGNKNSLEIEKKLSDKFSTVKNIEIVWGTSLWTITPEQIDLKYYPPASAVEILRVGRSGKLIKNLQTKFLVLKNGLVLDPVFSVDENKINSALEEISKQVNIPTHEPEILIVDGKISISNGENGQEIDGRELINNIRMSLAKLNSSPIQLPVNILNPKLSPTQVENLQLRGESLLGKKLVLKSGNNSWTISSEQTLAWVDPFVNDGWKRDLIESWVNELAQTIDRPAQNALFRFVSPANRVEEFKPAHPGFKTQQDKLIAQVIDSLTNLQKNGVLENTLEIPGERIEPTITNSQVNTLGIKEVIGRGESNYSGSIPNRIFNLKKAAQSINGVLVAPGEVFSFVKYVGDISAESGYKQAYIIKDGKTILGDGGGVCQVSTTLFRAILNAGLPVEDRTAHAYRVHYYENDSQPGLDATIFSPSTDFKFKNDTTSYILVQTSVDETKNKLYFDIYGTLDGRKVEISKVRLWDSAPPPPDLYQDDPTLLKGKVVQVDWSAWGIKAAFDWKVTRGGEVLQDRTFYSNFRPWQAIYLRGIR